jgi:hypothetical protein
VDWKWHGQEGQCWQPAAQGALRSTWIASTATGSSPNEESRLLEAWNGGEEGGDGDTAKEAGGGRRRVEKGAHGGHRWKRKTLVAAVVVVVPPVWTDQSRQLIIRLLGAIWEPKSMVCRSERPYHVGMA